MIPKILSSAFALATLVCGCASNHDLKTGGNWQGGGFRVDQVVPGLFKIEARTNSAPMTMEGTAMEMWAKHAKEACDPVPFREIKVRTSQFNSNEPFATMVNGAFLSVPYIVTVREGFALCTGIGPSQEQAADLAEKYVLPKRPN